MKGLIMKIGKTSLENQSTSSRSCIDMNSFFPPKFWFPAIGLGIILVVGCSENNSMESTVDSNSNRPPTAAPDSTRDQPSWPIGSYFEIQDKNDLAHPGWLSVSGWARVSQAPLRLEWDVLDSADSSLGRFFEFDIPDPGETDSVAFSDVNLIPNPLLRSGSYQLVMNFVFGKDSLVADSIPFSLNIPRLFVKDLRLAPDTLRSGNGYSYLEGNFYGAADRLFARLDVFDSEGIPVEERHGFAITWVANPTPGWPITEFYGVKAGSTTPPGNYRLRLTLWNGIGDTLRPEFPFQVLPRR